MTNAVAPTDSKLEIDLPSEYDPIWYRSGKVAECLLDFSDPAPRYFSPVNVQCSRARSELSHAFCL